MQVTLNIGANQIGETVLDLFKTLTEEQKKQIAGEVLRQWLKDPIPYEAAAWDEEAIAYVRKEDYQARDRGWNGERCRESAYYRRYMDKKNSSKAEMILEVQRQIITFYNSEIKQLVREDPQILKMKDAVCEVVGEMFPKIAHDAMVLFVAGNLDRAINATMSGLLQGSQWDNSGQICPSLNNVIGERISKAMQDIGVKR